MTVSYKESYGKADICRAIKCVCSVYGFEDVDVYQGFSLLPEQQSLLKTKPLFIQIANANDPDQYFYGNSCVVEKDNKEKIIRTVRCHARVYIKTYQTTIKVGNAAISSQEFLNILCSTIQEEITRSGHWTNVSYYVREADEKETIDVAALATIEISYASEQIITIEPHIYGKIGDIAETTGEIAVLMKEE